MKYLMLVIMGWLALAGQTQAASFDCRKAVTKVEQMICADPELSKLDEEMNAAYKNALQKNRKQAVAIKMAEKQWLNERNGCEDVPCVKRSYESRLAEIRNQSVKTTGAEAIFSGKKFSYIIIDQGKNQPFCEAIVAALNKTKPSEDHLPCIAEEVLKLPGVSDPAWQKLDLRQHSELVKKMMTLSAVGSIEYFREKKLDTGSYPTPELQQYRLENVQKDGAELFMMRLPSEYFGDRVLITLRRTSKGCGRPYEVRGEVSNGAWVTPDLKEIATGPGLFDSYAGRPLIYRGRLYFMNAYGGGDSLELYVPRHEYLSRICNIAISVE